MAGPAASALGRRMPDAERKVQAHPWRAGNSEHTCVCPIAGLAVLPLKSPFPGVPADPRDAQGRRAACFVTGGEKGRLKVWRADTGACLYEEPATGGGSVAWEPGSLRRAHACRKVQGC